jgi:hypothetical protein
MTRSDTVKNSLFLLTGNLEFDDPYYDYDESEAVKNRLNPESEIKKYSKFSK